MDQNNSKKYTSNNMKSIKLKSQRLVFIFSVLILIIMGIIISVAINATTVPVFDNNMDLSFVNVDKYAVKIKAQYDNQGQKELFVTEYLRIQDAVGSYILNNSTMDDNSLNLIVKTLRSEINKTKSDKLGITKSNYWAGDWNVLDDGKITFKFKSKKIEPSWINDNDVSSMITRN